MQKHRAVIQIPLDDIITMEDNVKRGIVEIVLEGDQYPNWHSGSEPMVIIGASAIKREEYIEYLCKY